MKVRTKNGYIDRAHQMCYIIPCQTSDSNDPYKQAHSIRAYTMPSISSASSGNSISLLWTLLSLRSEMENMVRILSTMEAHWVTLECKDLISELETLLIKSKESL